MLPARSETIRKLNVQGNVLVEQQEIQQGIFCANTISLTTCYVRFINTTEKNVILENFKPKTQQLENYHIHENLKQANVYAVQNIEERKKYIYKQTNIATLPECYQNAIGSICDEYNDVFFVDGDVLGVNNFYKQKISTTNDSPSYIRNYKLPFSQKEEIERQVQEMLSEGKIEPSFSPYNSPLLIVNKKTGEQRVVIDYRRVNKNIVADKFPLPRIDDILDQLGRAKYFSVLDLKSGFHQVGVEKESREITAFSTSGGHYQFNRLPFGLKISPNSFQRMMSIAMAGLTPSSAFLYIDDLVVFGCSLNQHNKNLVSVLERLRKYSLKLNPKNAYSCSIQLHIWGT
jgi:Reverse transcriptase (RNA-dependent DNA polymerase)